MTLVNNKNQKRKPPSATRKTTWFRGAAVTAAFFCVAAGHVFAAPAEPAKDKTARTPDPKALLRRMIEADTQRALWGREMTFITGGKQSEQIVKRDPKRGMRTEFVQPGNSIFVDNFKRSWLYAPRAKRLVERESRLEGLRRKIRDVARRIERGELRATWDGQDKTAGRAVDIVRVSPAEGVRAPSRRFWIDKQTGLRLKTEELGPQGRVLSGSYFLSVDLKPKFADDDFAPPKTPPDVQVQVEHKQIFASLEAAQKKTGFALSTPKYLPPGFALRAVTVVQFRGKDRKGKQSRDVVTQRYTNGLNLLSLFQTNTELPPRAFGRGEHRSEGVLAQGRGPRVITWRAKDVRFALVGNLPEDQMRRISDSLSSHRTVESKPQTGRP